MNQQDQEDMWLEELNEIYCKLEEETDKHIERLRKEQEESSKLDKNEERKSALATKRVVENNTFKESLENITTLIGKALIKDERTSKTEEAELIVMIERAERLIDQRLDTCQRLNNEYVLTLKDEHEIEEARKWNEEISQQHIKVPAKTKVFLKTQKEVMDLPSAGMKLENKIFMF